MVTLKFRNFFGFWRKSPIRSRRSPVQPRQVVIQLRIGKEFSRGCGVVVQLGGGACEIRAGVAQFVVKGVVRGELAETSLPRANVADHAVGVADRFLYLIV